MDAIAITGKPGVGGVSAPGYSDKNAYDTISKALDIYAVADMGISMSEIPLAALLEGGMIVTGAIAGIVGPLVALGAPYNDALKYKTRQHFFTAFCSTLVMTADGWSAATVDRFYPQLAYPAPRQLLSRKARNVPQTLQFRTQGRTAAGLPAEYSGPEKPLHPASVAPKRR